MKKVLASVAVVSCFAGAAYAGMEARTGVNGSFHDMTVVVPGYGDSMDRVCVFCHAPHNTIKDPNGINNYPLWNHALTNQVFTPYTWATPTNMGTDVDPVAFQIVDPLIGPSRLCMSCHDGSVAIDTHGGALAQPGVPTIINARANLGNDLSNDHPIGFDYKAIRTWRNSRATNADPVTGDTEIVDPTYGFATAVTNVATAPGVYNSITRPAPADPGRKIQDVLYQGNMMTCATCHEVHNKENVIQDAWNAANAIGAAQTTVAPNYFLYAKQTSSLICLSCHVK